MATIKDIANEVGISKAAVSRILNHKGSFSPETIAKVQRVANRLNYTTLTALHQEELVSNKIIAAIFPAVELPYFGLVASHMEKVAYDYGYYLMLCGSLFDRQKEEDVYKSLNEKKIDGVILGSYTKDPTMLAEQSFPVVTFGYKLADNIPTVRTDNYAVGRIAARHLYSRGCRRLLYVTSFQEELDRDMRCRGFEDGLREYGIEPWVYRVNVEMQLLNDFSEVITRMMLEHPEADGVFAETDALGMNCLQVFIGLGYEIPKDIKVIGYGNPFFSAFSNPKLTIVREDTKELARRTVSLLVDMIENEGKKEALSTTEIVIPVALDERKTT